MNKTLEFKTWALAQMFTIENREMRLKSCTHVLDKLGNTFPHLEIIKTWKRQNGGHELT